MSKILKNTTASAIAIKDTGITIPASPGTYTIPPQDYLLWSASLDMITPINSGDLVVNNGVVDLAAYLGLAYIVDLEIRVQNVVRVSKSFPGYGDFSSVTAALASITTASSSNPFKIEIGPGVYTESQIQMKPFVYLEGSGDQVTVLQPSNASQNFILITENSRLRNCLITGVTGSGFAALFMSSATGTDQTPALIEDCKFGNNDTHCIVSPVNATNAVFLNNCKIGGAYQFNNGFKAMTTGSGVGRISLKDCGTTSMSGTLPNYVVYATGTNCEILMNSCSFRTGGLSTGSCVQADNGGLIRASSLTLKGFGKALWAPNTGSAPTIFVDAIICENCTQDIQIDHASASGNVLGIANIQKITNSAILLGMCIVDTNTSVTAIRGLRTKHDVIVTSASTLNLVGGSAMVQDFTGNTSGQIVKLPNATTLMPGHRFEIWNQSSVTVLVQDNSGALLLISVPQQTATFVLKDNSTAAGIWIYALTFPAETVATWTGTRYFAVDYDNGNDMNVGYSDTSLADAGTKAIRTIERLRIILPNNGNGQIAVVGIRNRAGGATYRNIANTADDNIDLTNHTDYSQLIIRGTGTVATANTIAFSDDAADQVTCGAQIKSGTNANGYNPTGSPTASVISCQLNGGGAAGLSAEPALLGYRVRFAYNTTTVALRNAVGMIWSNTSSQITLGTDLPAIPVTSDVFYIEEPAVAIGRCFIFSNSPFNVIPGTFTTGGLQIAGIKFVSSTSPVIQSRGAIGLVNLSFIDVPNSTSFSAISVAGALDFRISPSYTNQAGATVLTGSGFRSEGSVTFSGCLQVIMTHHVTNQARPQILQVISFSLGGACVSAGGIIFQNCGSQPAVTNLGGNVLGNAGSATIRRFRSTGVNVGDAINITRSGVLIYGVDVTNTGSAPIITLKGVGLGSSINDVVGSTGNTGVGLDLTLARDCHILMGTIAANTFTGTAGQDISCSGSVFYLHADYARVDLKDRLENHVQGTGLSNVGTVSFAANDTNANIGQYRIVRATASSAVRVALATSNANASGVVGVCQSSFTTAQGAMLCNGGGTWIQFDGAPTVGNIAYLSNVNAGQARDTPTPLNLTNQKLRLGRILAASGTLGFVSFFPECLPVLSDGAA